MSGVRARKTIARVALVLLSAAICGPRPAAATPAASVLPTVEPNDNRRSAGAFDDGAGTLTLALRAGRGRWQPEGRTGPTLEVEAFGEADATTLTVPAPLIRVTEGTTIVVTIRNDLESALVVHGLCTRDGTPCVPVDVPPHRTQEVRFDSGPAGTYHYWASTFGAPIPFRELAGAFVVDPAGERVGADRVLVVTEWTSLTARQLAQIASADVPTQTFVDLAPRLTFVINGMSWPATERFTYDLGERVRWRVINLSSQAHPMHLHGFYFDVDSLGNGITDTRFEASHRRRVVTQLVPSGGTMTMTWVPERAGNWLFHCHVMHHVSLDRRLGAPEAHEPHTNGHANEPVGTHDRSLGMAGMVIGVTVRDGGQADSASSADRAPTPARRLTLLMQPTGERDGELPEAGFVLVEGDAAAARATPSVPGPTLVLRRDEPVEITLVNRLPEATAIHWHGMELDSYYDGVHGWSGVHRRITPMIASGDSFVVRFTPPRAGTFIYHTHLHDYRQLSSGLYGALIVTDASETFDPASDHVVVIGRRGLTSESRSLLTDPDSVVINGVRAPRLVLTAGVRHRVRLVNITPDDIFSVSLQGADGVLQWRPVAKDGADVPEAQAVVGPARQIIAVGETYDLEFEAPEGRRTAWLELRTPGGKWQAQGHVVIG